MVLGGVVVRGRGKLLGVDVRLRVVQALARDLGVARGFELGEQRPVGVYALRGLGGYEVGIVQILVVCGHAVASCFS